MSKYLSFMEQDSEIQKQAPKIIFKAFQILTLRLSMEVKCKKLKIIWSKWSKEAVL